MPAASLFVVDKRSALRHAPRLVREGFRVVYLVNDFTHKQDVQRACGADGSIDAVPELFHRTVEELRQPYLDFIAGINERNACLSWWSGHFASKNPAASPLFQNLVRLFVVLKLVKEDSGSIAIVLDNPALMEAVREEVVRRGCGVRIIAPPLAFFRQRVWQGLKAFLRLGYFVYLVAKLGAESRVCRSEIAPAPGKRRVLLRSWILESSFDKDGQYQDRLFGEFPRWLEKQGYEVWHYPLFLDVALVSQTMFVLMQNSGERWLLPQRYLSMGDYIEAVRTAWGIAMARLDDAALLGVSIETVLRGAIRNELFAFDLMFANLGHAMLGRLRERDVEFERMFYSFEGNAHEKVFILACRKHYPAAPVAGFHPTALFVEEYAYYLGKGEARFHPLPDRLFCGGPVYLDAFERTGLPPEILALGVNLRTRFQPLPSRDRDRAERKAVQVFIALSGVDRHQTIELLFKTTHALQPVDRYRIHIRTHPAFTRVEIESMLSVNGISNYAFADDGAMQDWLAQSDVMITQGCTMAMIEGVAMGVPVIRIRPENNLFYDAIAWTEYPLDPVFTVGGIGETIEMIAAIREADPECFQRLALAARRAYFEPVTEEGLRRFLVSRNVTPVV